MFLKLDTCSTFIPFIITCSYEVNQTGLLVPTAEFLCLLNVQLQMTILKPLHKTFNVVKVNETLSIWQETKTKSSAYFQVRSSLLHCTSLIQTQKAEIIHIFVVDLSPGLCKQVYHKDVHHYLCFFVSISKNKSLHYIEKFYCL